MWLPPVAGWHTDCAEPRTPPLYTMRRASQCSLLSSLYVVGLFACSTIASGQQPVSEGPEWNAGGDGGAESMHVALASAEQQQGGNAGTAPQPSSQGGPRSLHASSDGLTWHHGAHGDARMHACAWGAAAASLVLATCGHICLVQLTAQVMHPTPCNRTHAHLLLCTLSLRAFKYVHCCTTASPT